MSNTDNTQPNPDHKTCNCKNGTCKDSSDYTCKKDSCNCGSGCNCGENCTCNTLSAPISSPPSNGISEVTTKKNTCTLFTLNNIIIIDLDEN